MSHVNYEWKMTNSRRNRIAESKKNQTVHRKGHSQGEMKEKIKSVSQKDEKKKQQKTTNKLRNKLCGKNLIKTKYEDH